MRRPHVYERSVPRARWDVEHEAGADYGPAARAVLTAVPALLREAEAVGATTLARFLGQALTEAEGIVRRAPWIPTGHQSREGRLLAGMSQSDLAVAADVTFGLVVRVDLVDWLPMITRRDATALQTVLETAGVEFIAENGGAVVRLRKVEI